MRSGTLALAILLVLPTLAFAKKQEAPLQNPDDPSALQVRENIKVVYHATKDTWKKGVPQTLYYVDRVVRVAYPDKMGVPTSALDFKIVAHDTPVYWFLNDAGWKASKHKGASVPQDHNPNKELVASLIAAGVDIEVCGHTMEQQGYTAEMLLPGVKVAPAGLPRVIDLQMMGYQRMSLE
jgi:intracellular sulfur oxidation DsrE/DsrF family protein